ncbi:NAD(P)-dependent oxidoreductase [Polaromonas sp. SM01]|uniref:NAD(P)-dependent oxidoreductase n=1 Tax=Polaromonas sp. SM01 TaxID=3085630 RepID=UPI0029812021|nr:NAD(P)-dependent oxidoreductase [Polaromonas sp. SM01]MDW5444657.1 NAD(P)-dependent oxidoreductase [Polaromonas sp. SM01]
MTDPYLPERNPAPQEIGWIGLGRMGSPMAHRLLAAGHRVSVWARRPEAAASLLAAGAGWAESPVALARRCGLVVSMLTGPDDVLALYEQMMPAAGPGTVFVDMSTASPSTAIQLARWASQSAVDVLDVPVTGGVAGAQNGTLTLFVGGSSEVLARCRPVLATLSQRLVHCGEAGAGYRMKLINQTMMAGALLGLANGAAMARAAGCSADILHEALGTGTASGALFHAYLGRMLSLEGPETFTLGLLRKDLLLARDESPAGAPSTAFLSLLLSLVDDACARFGPDRGVQFLGA